MKASITIIKFLIISMNSLWDYKLTRKAIYIMPKVEDMLGKHLFLNMEH